jgi:hypothetical protein
MVNTTYYDSIYDQCTYSWINPSTTIWPLQYNIEKYHRVNHRTVDERVRKSPHHSHINTHLLALIFHSNCDPRRTGNGMIGESLRYMWLPGLRWPLVLPGYNPPANCSNWLGTIQVCDFTIESLGIFVNFVFPLIINVQSMRGSMAWFGANFDTASRSGIFLLHGHLGPLDSDETFGWSCTDSTGRVAWLFH